MNPQSGKSKYPINVILIEDNRFIRAGWESVLQADDSFTVIGSFGNCEDVLKNEILKEADVLLLDIGLPGMSGINAISLIKLQNPGIAIVMCTVYDDDQNVFDALCLGAVGYLLKKTPPEELRKALQDAMSGGSPMTPVVARKVIASFQKPASKSSLHDDELTEREREILDRMAQGKSYAAIARELFLSIDGVRYHIRHIYEKLQVHSRAEAVSQGLKNKIVRFPH